MRSIIWTTNEEFAQKLLTQIIGSQPVIRKRQTNAKYWIEYGDKYNIVYWIRGNDCFCGLRCDVSYVDTDTCSVQYFDTVIRVMTSLGKYGKDQWREQETIDRFSKVLTDKMAEVKSMLADGWTIDTINQVWGKEAL